MSRADEIVDRLERSKVEREDVEWLLAEVERLKEEVAGRDRCFKHANSLFEKAHYALHDIAMVMWPGAEDYEYEQIVAAVSTMRAEVERLKPVVDAAVAWKVRKDTDDERCDRLSGERLAQSEVDLYNTMLDYEATQ